MYKSVYVYNIYALIHYAYVCLGLFLQIYLCAYTMIHNSVYLDFVRCCSLFFFFNYLIHKTFFYIFIYIRCYISLVYLATNFLLYLSLNLRGHSSLENYKIKRQLFYCLPQLKRENKRYLHMQIEKECIYEKH